MNPTKGRIAHRLRTERPQIGVVVLTHHAEPEYALALLPGLLQTAGFVLYRVAGRSGEVAVPSVLSSQFAVFAIVAGVVVLGERLSHRQIGGLAGLLVGVAVVAGTQS